MATQKLLPLIQQAAPSLLNMAVESVQAPPANLPTSRMRTPSEMRGLPPELGIQQNPYDTGRGFVDSFTPMQAGGGRFKTEEDSTFWNSETGSFEPKPEAPWYKRMMDDPALMSKLALGFNTMRLNPDAQLAAALNERIKTAGEVGRAKKSQNKTLVALQNMGMDPAEAELLGDNPELLKVAMSAMYKARTGQDATAEMLTFDAMTKDMSDADKQKARRIKLGLDPRAGLPIEEYFSRGYAGASGTAAATAQAKVIEQAQTNRILKAQLDFGFDNLGAALGATGQTGKIFGNLPAVTTGAQLADNAKAILLPLMKGVWRGAGEGVFTDKDQETLEAMFPSRDMNADAAKQALLVVRQLTELKLQNPTFDINAYGNAMRNRGAPAPAAPAVATPTPAAPAPAAPTAPAPSVRDEADRILRGAQ
jgi:hypothetical protein